MAEQVEPRVAVESVTSLTRSGSGAPSLLRRRLFADRLARRFVTFGGTVIIISILAILFVILAEVYPLFEPPVITPLETVSLPSTASPLGIDVEEYREIAYAVTETGIQFVSLAAGSLLLAPAIPGLDTARVTATAHLDGGPIVLGLSDGRILPVEVSFSTTFDADGIRLITPMLAPGEPEVARTDGQPVTLLASNATGNGTVTAVMTAPRDILLITVEEQRSLFGDVERRVSRQLLSLPVNGAIRALAIDERGDNLFAGISTGQMARFDLRVPDGPRLADIVSASSRPGIAITVLGFLLGDRTLVVGDAAGGVGSWQVVREPDGEERLHKIYEFLPHPGAITAFAASRRDKGFITADGSGEIHLSYGTTGRTLSTVETPIAGIETVAFAPKADGFLAVDASGRLVHWSLENPHPEITWRSLFGKIWYEGSAGPEYVWQSTGGSDDFEAKFSLTPLIYGTLKGTFYSLLFAIPLALLGALYVSQFMHPTLKNAIKPVVEIMAALPSVVLGFIAGLWLAPVVERHVPALLILPFLITACILVAHALWQYAPRWIRHSFKPGAEVFLLVPVVLAGGWLAYSLGDFIENLMLAGDYRTWLFETLGLTYDQRNSLVVGFAMGFAVIPIIFTIAEDSLSNVPQSLVAGSLALGATRWQTAIRMVLPSASPGIFSAIMIGFGRAVGETMIVLMATGNTPVMDWSIFNGFRALSANITVELPEAPQGGTLYRVLFLGAFLLFVTTFVVNTVAEVIRLRLRKKYRYL